MTQRNTRLCRSHKYLLREVNSNRANVHIGRSHLLGETKHHHFGTQMPLGWRASIPLFFAGRRLQYQCVTRLTAEPGNTAERALRPYVIWRKTSFFSQSERGDLFRARVMTVAETCRRLDLCAYTLLREVCEQGIRGEAVTIRLPIDHIYSIPTSHQIEKKAA